MMNITHKIVKQAICYLLLPFAVSAEEAGPLLLEVPNFMRMTFEMAVDYESHSVPIGILRDGEVPIQKIKGPSIRRAWQSSDDGITLDQFADTLLRKLIDSGYHILLDCHDRICGGFDFRFKIDILPAPHIFVNLSNFRFVTLQSHSQFKTILISKLGDTLSLQINEVAKGVGIKGAIIRHSNSHATHKKNNGIGDALKTDGYAILRDLEYESGSAKLGVGPFQSLLDLATYMKSNKSTNVILVGHTDNVGSLNANINLSKKRANAVVERLIATYDIDANRLSDEGVGYLTPITSNETEEGREFNRRVEVILGDAR